MELLTGRIRNYPWGSRELIANLRGEEESLQPEAELWFGAHPAASATIGDQELIELIAADPAFHLGERVRKRFGDNLPFLLKILAAAEPLSLQAHPSLSQAQEGYARENAQGIDVAADYRNYKDANHKPELIVALTEFEAMAGFRPLAKTLELFDELHCAEIERYLAMLDRSEARESTDLRVLFTTWITIPSASRTKLIDDIVTSAALALARTDLPQWMREELANVVALHQRYPYDVGVLGALLLNKFTLQPGEGLYLDAGQLHAYVKGLGVEIMANSDNVLRGGLTSKHVDVPELVRVLEFESLEDPRVRPIIRGRNVEFPTPITEFSLTKWDLSEGAIFNADGPAIILVTEGGTDLTCDGRQVHARAGEAVWIPAGDPEVRLAAADATVFVATV
ncbi:Mannose-6-phosphate isomerase [Corynebacterium kalinowskii]|uniref:mannose-6-phosphate isomerase n=1 Tax=Corynebacterium kalinowskii TaxID=2675216 RepID=A0A6B8VS26_9CORY|nr:mannose-6-phosphate isomerase, class I [Corynebacterium kalinowskii]QGU02691.1 Mannose-6-phosphate isomerase [Corynebacterium kalinowskii]